MKLHLLRDDFHETVAYSIHPLLSLTSTQNTHYAAIILPTKHTIYITENYTVVCTSFLWTLH